MSLGAKCGHRTTRRHRCPQQEERACRTFFHMLTLCEAPRSPDLRGTGNGAFFLLRNWVWLLRSSTSRAHLAVDGVTDFLILIMGVQTCAF